MHLRFHAKNPMHNLRQDFLRQASHQKKGWGKFCSKACQSQGMRTGRTFPCSTCEKSTYRTPKDENGSKEWRFFCDKRCFAKWKNKLWAYGEEHFNWKGGESAYRALMLHKNIAPICNKCKIVDIRILIVHHIDHDRKNNSESNLRWLCRNCHYLAHSGKTF